MTQELIDYCTQIYSNAQGQKYPCSNQIVGCFIICDKIDYKFQELLNQKNGKIIIKNSNGYKVKFNNTIWRVRRCSENLRGCRYYKIYIDTRISNELIEQLIMPCMTNYCKEVHFF